MMNNKFRSFLCVGIAVLGGWSFVSCGNTSPTILPSSSTEQSPTTSVVSFVTPAFPLTDTPSSDSFSGTSETPTSPSFPTPSTSTPVVPSSPTPATPSSPTTETTPQPPFSASGAASSDTETSLNVYFEWSVNETESGTFLVKVSAYLNHYSLRCGERTGSENVIFIGENSFPYSTPSFNFSDGTGRHQTPLATAEYEYTAEDLPESLSLSVSWNFHGQYSQKEIGIITATAVVNLSGAK